MNLAQGLLDCIRLGTGYPREGGNVSLENVLKFHCKMPILLVPENDCRTQGHQNERSPIQVNALSSPQRNLPVPTSKQVDFQRDDWESLTERSCYALPEPCCVEKPEGGGVDV